MKKTFLNIRAIIACATLGLSIFVASCDQEETEVNEENTEERDPLVGFEDGDKIEGQYVVYLTGESGKYIDNDLLLKTKDYQTRQSIVEDANKKFLSDMKVAESNLLRTYSASGALGFAAKLAEKEVLSMEKAGALVLEDRMVILAPWYCQWFPSWPGCNDEPDPDPNPDPDQGTQTTPWGIAKVGGAVDFSNSSKKAWVLDTGIDSRHSDLNVDVQSGRSFIRGEGREDDGNGHGTHVAGTIGAIDNNFGVVGVAAGVSVVPIKVLSRFGSGSTSGIVAGLDYIAQNANPGDVANLSLGGGISPSLDRAVVNLGARGVYVTLAAGNEGQDANNVSPARANGENVYTISNMTSAERLAGSSNYGSPVDYAAPGTRINSTWRGNRYNTISGTSMAAPHAAGVLLVTEGNPKSIGNITGDRDNRPDPIIAH